MHQSSNLAGPRLTFLGTLEDRPFRADFQESVRPLGDADSKWKQTLSGTMFRDSQGRTKFLIRSVESTPCEFGSIFDPHKNTLIVFDVMSGSCTETFLGGGDGASGWQFMGPGHIKPLDEQREIEGLRCRLFQVEAEDGRTIVSSWACDEYGVVLFEQRQEDVGAVRWEMTNLGFKEPDPAVFELPCGDERREE